MELAGKPLLRNHEIFMGPSGSLQNLLVSLEPQVTGQEGSEATAVDEREVLALFK